MNAECHKAQTDDPHTCASQTPAPDAHEPQEAALSGEMFESGAPQLFEPHEECGVFGVFNHPEAPRLTYLGLYALQHRGQEAAGIVSTNGQSFFEHRRNGMVADIFDAPVLERLAASHAIGHVRYSTAGGSGIANVQPLFMRYRGGSLALSHNGNLVNAQLLRLELENRGSIFQSTLDTEVIMHLVACSIRRTLVDRIVDALLQVKGAYSLLFLGADQLIAVRDPNGFRPLVLGRLGTEDSPSWVLASESCALDLINAEYVREIEPGELIVIDKDGVRSMRPFPATRPTPCIFEYVYFARPDSHVFGHGVYDLRVRMGRALAQESAVEADVVIPVPDSGVPAALGYGQASGLPFQFGLIRNHYVGRTFIEPKQSIRNFGVKIKLNPVRAILEGKRVVVIDDSIVRGTTSRKIIQMVRDAGAREVHLRIAAPPTIGPCYYGINTPTEEELIAHKRSLEEIRAFIQADSLAYLSEAGLFEAVRGEKGQFCDACFSYQYPVEVEDKALPLVSWRV